MNLKNIVVLILILFSLDCLSQQKNVVDNKRGKIQYDQNGCLFTTYRGLVMAGYQGWFNAEGDGSGRGASLSNRQEI